jgi:mannose-6-phosphate isomerase-like protein (cupin superfamily)
MNEKEGLKLNSIGANFVLAPDGSEIRLLQEANLGGLSECTLTIDGISSAVCHQTVEEIWFFTQGIGQVWRRMENTDQIDDVRPGVSLLIPLGVHFQFRNTGTIPLKFIISTMPPWPGPNEACLVDGKWDQESSSSF